MLGAGSSWGSNAVLLQLHLRTCFSFIQVRLSEGVDGEDAVKHLPRPPLVAEKLAARLLEPKLARSGSTIRVRRTTVLRLADDDECEAGEALALERHEERAEARDGLVRVQAVQVECDLRALLNGERPLGAGEHRLGDHAEADAPAALVPACTTVWSVVGRPRAALVAPDGLLDELLPLLDDPVRRVAAWWSSKPVSG